jgi:hypothetical protein
MKWIIGVTIAIAVVVVLLLVDGYLGAMNGRSLLPTSWWELGHRIRVWLWSRKVKKDPTLPYPDEIWERYDL